MTPKHCGSADHFDRRNLLKWMGLSGFAWLTPLGDLLARGAERSPHVPAKSLILLWLDGGPSQLETFDPHPGKAIAAGTTAVESAVKGVRLAAGLARVAEQMESMVIIRNVVSKEGDHERASYNVKTGYRPDPTLTHPSMGAVLAHQLPTGATEIPRHVSILPGAWPGRGGYLGDAYDAFKTDDPIQPVPDVTRQVSEERFSQRLANVEFLDREFAAGRLPDLEHEKTFHQSTIQRSVRMMSSEQLEAFNVGRVPQRVRREFGNTPFGRGRLAAARLVEVGVRCVEVTLGGWDLAHVANHSAHQDLNAILDPALSGLLAYLKERDQFRETVVMCCGEFGRTPQLNAAAGRDHWPHGFSIMLAGGGLAGGLVVGETDPDGGRVPFDRGIPVENVHATVMQALGVDFSLELDTPVNRPMKLSQGRPLEAVLR